MISSCRTDEGVRRHHDANVRGTEEWRNTFIMLYYHSPRDATVRFASRFLLVVGQGEDEGVHVQAEVGRAFAPHC